jgi:hypothetical protein
MPGTLFTPGKEPVPIVREAGWAPGAGLENLAPTGIRSPDRPARSQSLYRLSYPAPHSRYEGLLITGNPYFTTLENAVISNIKVAVVEICSAGTVKPQRLARDVTNY